MCGSETLTIEVSSTSSTVPSITATATSHLCAAAGRSSAIRTGVALATRNYLTTIHIRGAALHANGIAAVSVFRIDGLSSTQGALRNGLLPQGPQLCSGSRGLERRARASRAFHNFAHGAA